MTSELLQQLIEGQVETPQLDFKANMPWDVKGMAKDFIAMSNLRDGGQIIVGVKEENNRFIPEGITEYNADSYNMDQMRDQLSKYAYPSINFKVFNKVRLDEKLFTVITIYPFTELPIICKKDIPDQLRSNTIYYRNTDKKVESAPISNLMDLRDLLELSAIKIMQRRKNFGYTVTETSSVKIQKQIGDISKTHTLKKIQKYGYWEVIFAPANEGKMSLKDCNIAVQAAQSIRSWYFPYIPGYNNKNESINTGHDYYQAESDNGMRKEFWRMYQSEFFVLYAALVDDWYSEVDYMKDLAVKYPIGTSIGINSSIVHFLTQAIIFLQGLVIHGLYKSGVTISFTLNNTIDRELVLDDDNSFPLFNARKTVAPKIEFTDSFDPNQIRDDNLQISTNIISHILDRFSFHTPIENIRRMQKTFLEGR